MSRKLAKNKETAREPFPIEQFWGSLEEQRRREVLGVLFTAVSLTVFLALISYPIADSDSWRTLITDTTSNLIGKPRFVPVNRRNALMILAPTAHVEPFLELIEQLDKPGDQVVLHAIITEVQHDDESTLGVRIASDPSILNDSRLADQSIGGGADIDFSRSVFGGDGILNANMDLSVLLQLLIRNVNLRILNEPRVYTADNQEAHFFDGQDVPVILSDQTSRDSGDTFNRSFDFRSVGTRLHIRPHITQEGDVDLEVKDEGEYWETEDFEKLREKKQLLHGMIDRFSEALSDSEFLSEEASLDDIVARIEEIAKKVQKDREAR